MSNTQRWSWKRAALALMCAALAGGCTSETEQENATYADEEFVEACLSVGNLEREICECTAEKAKDELTPNARAFVIASLTNDREEIQRLRDELDMQDALTAGKFMAKAPGDCAEELQ
ncbi:MAG: hypothetical protein E4H03_01010 [Myxococcales bacterium]|jgi:hypothetical protein|nr:MAG: hypothetical protein E4H03_01010 [Myxococcales bacterium]